MARQVFAALDIPPNVPLARHELCVRCFRTVPSDRPSAVLAEKLLKELLALTDNELDRLTLGTVAPSVARR